MHFTKDLGYLPSMRIVRITSLIGGLVLALGSFPALAQGIQSAADAPQEGEEIKGDTGVAEINEVERGFYVSVDVGPNHYLYLDQPGFVAIGRPLFEDVARPTSWFSPGTRMGLRTGYDVLNNINAEMFLTANFNEGAIRQTDLQAGTLTGDLSHFVAGVGGRFAFLTLPVEYPRWFVYGRAGVGYAVWFPNALAQNSFGSIHVDGSIGVEYYTKLRHLSIGAEVAFQSLLLPFAFGLQVYPTVKYTF